jgi:hypothetical protein
MVSSKKDTNVNILICLLNIQLSRTKKRHLKAEKQEMK